MVFSDENDPDESSNQILKCLFDVWCIARPLRIPENEYLSKSQAEDEYELAHPRHYNPA